MAMIGPIAPLSKGLPKATCLIARQKPGRHRVSGWQVGVSDWQLRLNGWSPSWTGEWANMSLPLPAAYFFPWSASTKVFPSCQQSGKKERLQNFNLLA